MCSWDLSAYNGRSYPRADVKNPKKSVFESTGSRLKSTVFHKFSPREARLRLVGSSQRPRSFFTLTKANLRRTEEKSKQLFDGNSPSPHQPPDPLTPLGLRFRGCFTPRNSQKPIFLSFFDFLTWKPLLFFLFSWVLWRLPRVPAPWERLGVWHKGQTVPKIRSFKRQNHRLRKTISQAFQSFFFSLQGE